jgi:hypothetical protein
MEGELVLGPAAKKVRTDDSVDTSVQHVAVQVALAVLSRCLYRMAIPYWFQTHAYVCAGGDSWQVGNKSSIPRSW